MVSVQILVNGQAVPSSAQTVSAGSTVTLSVSDTTGLKRIDWSFVGRSNDIAYPTIVKSGSPLGATATFTAPTPDGYGQTLIFECVANGGRDSAGNTDPNLRKRSGVSVLNVAGLRPVAAGQTLEFDTEFGWCRDVNIAMASAGSAGGTATLQQVLTNGNTTGGQNIVLSSGSEINSNDAVISLGKDTDIDGNLTVTSAQLSTFLEVGSSPSAFGTIRLPHGSDGVWGRNAAGDNNRQLVDWANTNTLTLGGGADITRIDTSSAANPIQLRTGSTTRLTIDSTAVALGATPLSIGATPATTGPLRFSHGTDFYSRNSANDNNFVWLDVGSSGANRVTLGSGADSTVLDVASASQFVTIRTGGTRRAEFNSTENFLDGYTRIGKDGSDIVQFHSPSGSTLATAGTMRVAHGFTLQGRTTGAANRTIVDFGVTTTDQLFFGDANLPTTMRANSTGIFLQTGGSNRVVIQGTAVTLQPAVDLQFGITHTTPTILQADTTTGSATGSPMSIHAQNATGATSTGGTLTISSGTGTTTAGELILRRGTTAFLSANSSNQVTISASGGITLSNSVSCGSSVSMNGGGGNFWTFVGGTSISASGTASKLIISGSSSVAVGATFDIRGSDTTGSSQTGGILTIQGGNGTGATSTGGALVLKAGTGTSTHGLVKTIAHNTELRLEGDSAVKRIWRKQGTVSTVDTTPQTVLTFDLTGLADGVGHLDVSVDGYCTSGTDASEMVTGNMFASYRIVTGVVQVVNSDDGAMPISAYSQFAGAMAISNSGASILVRVTGVAGDNVTWYGDGELTYVDV